ncbi:MAG: MFS transporter [Desulfobulbaceae bacterium]|nr:MFS transporter [Desulfobulbaceae bacterium]
MSESRGIDRVSSRLVFVTVSAGVFMSTMDSSMVNVALPVLMKTFHSSLALTEWVVLVYLLTITMLLVLWGKLCSRWGCGKVYSRGMLLFATGSLLCGMAHNIWLLILYRFVQALGASMMMATGPALIRLVFPPQRLGRGLGMVGVATSLGLMAGPAVSGLILRWLHWRVIFWVTVPVGFLFFLMSRKMLAGCSTPQTGRAEKPRDEQLPDFAGALLWAAMVSLTLLAATHATTLCCGGGTASSLVFITGSCGILAGWIFFVWYEIRTPAPFFPVRLFRRRFFVMAMLSSALSFAALFFVLILMPFYLDRVLRLPPDRIGYVMMALPLCVFIVSPAAGRLYDRFGARIVATAGLLCCLGSLILLTRITADTSALAIAFRLALLGFGQAMFLSPNSASALGGVADDHAGVTASLLATARNFGMLAGTALAGLSFTLHFALATGGLDMKEFVSSETPAFVYTLKVSFGYAAIIAFCAVAASLLRGAPGRGGRKKQSQP